MACWLRNPVTMTPEDNPGRMRYALLQNGSSFACKVLRELQHQGFAPDLLVLPEYAPAGKPGSVLMAVAAESRLAQLAGDIEIDYAPQAEQSRLAERLQRENCDFLLVACWPYLIGPAIVDSVTQPRAQSASVAVAGLPGRGSHRRANQTRRVAHRRQLAPIEPTLRSGRYSVASRPHRCLARQRS